MRDRFGREIDYMRVSITDRCNMRCRYCMPDGCRKVGMDQILTYEEILMICEAAVSLGINKFKITGGEPLVRLGCTELISRLKRMPGVKQVTLTTNGVLLPQYLPELTDAGLDGVNISLDSFEEERFSWLTGGGKLENTLAGLEAALGSSIPVKINCILQKGINEEELPSFAEFAFERGIDVRFIELMPVGCGDPERGVPGPVVLAMLMEMYPDLIPDDSGHGNGPAIYYHLPGKKGAVGLINALHGKFCSSCNRIRLTSKGIVKPCLCCDEGVDLRPCLRKSRDEFRKGVLPAGERQQENGEEKEIALLAGVLRETIMQKPEGHSFLDSKKREGGLLMSQIGG